MTFLFTDIEGSTPLWERYPVEMAASVERHDVVLRGAISGHGGYVFSTGGDAFAVAFGTAASAVAAAVEAQLALISEPWLEKTALTVRMGLHTGEVQERGGDYFGPAVNVAARIMSRALGPQVLMSDVTASLIDSTVAVRRLGRVRLRGVSVPVEVASVVEDGLVSELPYADSRQHAGTAALETRSAFIGRGLELGELDELLERGRLLTLTGVGGVGKTRLALELARGAGDRFEDGWVLVELAPVGEAASVVDALMAALGVRPQPGVERVDAVIDEIRDRSLLLVLDNCEHLLGPVATLVEQLVGSSPRLSLIATSREPLGIAGEQIFPVPSLDPASDAIDLFVAVCRTTDPHYELNTDDVSTVARVCQRLDGIPLAIELAAARTRTLSPTEILERLEDRFRLLRGSRRSVVDRHRTLQATIEWSYRLLDDNEGNFFRRLSVFSSSFDMAAASAICADEPGDDIEVVDLVDSLVAKSLLTSIRSGNHTRFRLLETLRAWGESLLDDTEIANLRDRHLKYFGQLAEHARILYEETDGHAGGRIFDIEWDNILAAISWGADADELSGLAKLTNALGHFAFNSVRLHELIPLLIGVVDRQDCPPAVLGVVAYAKDQVGDLSAALELAEKGIEASPADPDYFCLMSRWVSHWYMGNLEQGWTHLQDSLARTRSSRRPIHLLTVLGASAVCAYAALGPDHGHEFVRDAERVARPLNSAAASSMLVITRAGAQQGNPSAMRKELESLADIADEPGLQFFPSFAAALMAGSDADPASLIQAIRLLRERQDWLSLWVSIESAAIHLHNHGDLTDAAVVMGYLDAHDRRHAVNIEHRRDLSEQLPRSHPEAIATGASMTRDEVVDFVVTRLTSISDPSDSPA